jgi:hypothetical protein
MIKELIAKYKEAEKELESLREQIMKELDFGNTFEWIRPEGQERGKFDAILEERIIDGVRYGIEDSDSYDHETHYILFIEKV